MSTDTNNKASQNPRRPYSFINVLDNFGHNDLALTRVATRQDDLDRVSTTLYTLTSRKHGSKHLPEVPTYDNGNVVLAAMSIQSPKSSPVLEQTSKRRLDRTQDRSTRLLPEFSMEQPFDTLTWIASTQSVFLAGESDIRRSKRLGPASNQTRPLSVSAQRSRPVSTHGMPKVHRIKTQRLRVESSDSTSRSNSLRKKSISFDDQRYCASSETVTSPPRTSKKPSRLMGGFKDLRTKAENKRRMKGALTTSIQPRPPTPMLTLQEALQGGLHSLPSLHDPRQDYQFGEDCARLLSFKREPSQFSFVFPQVTQGQASPLGELARTPRRTLRHKHEKSETTSIDSSILDWPHPPDWKILPSRHEQREMAPRPESTLLPNGPLELVTPDLRVDTDDGHRRSPSARVPLLWTAPMVEKRLPRSPPPLNSLPPTAPPERPLPQLPCGTVGDAWERTLQMSRIYPQPPVSPVARLGLNRSLPLRRSPRSDRIQQLAGIKGLSLDTGVQDEDATDIYEGNDVRCELIAAPFGEHLNKSIRTSRVKELKQRHLAILCKQNGNPTAGFKGPLEAADLARRGSAPEIASLPKTPRHTRCPSSPSRGVGNRLTPLSAKPPSAHSRNFSCSSTGFNKARLTRVRDGSGATRDIRQSVASNPRLKQKISQSKIMTLVDTDPTVAHGFSAGAAPTIRLGRQAAERSHRPVHFANIDVNSSDGSRPCSLESIVSTVQSEGTDLTVLSDSQREISDAIDSALMASFDSGYGSADSERSDGKMNWSRDGDVDAYDYVAGSIQDQSSGVETTPPVTGSTPVLSPPQHQADPRVDRLKDELHRMKRVYKAMEVAQRHKSSKLGERKSYAKLLHEDRSSSPPLRLVPQGDILAKIEADLAQPSPMFERESSSASTITPSTIQTGSLGSKQFGAITTTSPSTSRAIQTQTQPPIKAISTLLTTSKRQRPHTAPSGPTSKTHPATSTSTNRHPPPPRGSSLPSSRDITPTRPNTAPSPSRSHSPNNEMEMELTDIATSTTQMDQAIDALKASTIHDHNHCLTPAVYSYDGGPGVAQTQNAGGRVKQQQRDSSVLNLDLVDGLSVRSMRSSQGRYPSHSYSHSHSPSRCSVLTETTVDYVQRTGRLPGGRM